MMGLAVAVTIKCPHCEMFSEGVTQMNEDMEEELAEVAANTGQNAFWEYSIPYRAL